MEKYNRLKGVPDNFYYLTEIKQFSDFETPQIEEILYVAEDKQELINLCEQNHLSLTGSWIVYHIRQNKADINA